MNDKERYETITKLLDELKEQLIEYLALTREHYVDEYPEDYSYECSMCGKDMSRSTTGRCSSCEQEWNG